MKNNSSLKYAIKFIIRHVGINTYLAYKKHNNNFYATLKSMLWHNWDIEDIYYHLHWQLSMIKDFAQYQ